jgi:uncharacterized protein (TIGR02646 family)
MRRVYKSQPPVNVSPEGQERCSMLEAERRLTASLATMAGATVQERAEHARGHFDALEKKNLRDVLHEEQRHLCVYCERRIKNKVGPDAPPIEHWRPLSRFPAQALHWDNLYLSCRRTNVSSCDDSKGHMRLVWDEADEDLPWPSETAYEEWLGFTSGGEIYVRTDARISEAARRALELAIKAILNLDDPALREARREALDNERRRLGKDFPGRTATAEERAARAEEVLRSSSYPAFVSIRVAWLRHMLGRHRPSE